MRKYPLHIPILGERFGDFEVISNQIFKKENDNHTCFKVKCKCGHEQLVVARMLKNGKSTKCKSCAASECLNLGKFTEGPKTTKVGDLTLSVYNNYIRGAKKRKLEWDEHLTMSYLSDLFLKQNKKCALTGQDISLKYESQLTKSKQMTASLDRIDSQLGYVVGNVQWVHKEINRFKNNYSQQEFLKMCKLIIDHANQQPS